MRAAVVGALALAAVYLAGLGDPKPLDVPIALAVAVGALMTVGESPLGRARGRRPLAPRVVAVPRLVAHVVADVVAGTLRVALVVLGLRAPRRPGVVRVDVGPCSERALVLTGLLLTLSPGSILVAADAEHGRLDVHVVDGDDAESVRRDVRRLHDLTVRVTGG